MHPELRARFNKEFSPLRYGNLLRAVNETVKWPADFRISETPIFLTDEFTHEVINAADEVIDLLLTSEFDRHSALAIPEGLEVPHEPDHPNFLVVDFGICEDENGHLTPRLIELQAFPSLFGFQFLLLACMRHAYPAIPQKWTSSFRGMQDEGYLNLLRKTIVADSDPERVVLLEIEPEKQKTRIDFAATERLLGVRPVCVTEVIRHGKQLFYKHDGREIRIERVYNRVIFDELLRRTDLEMQFSFQDDLDVTWVGHPNWYFRISKHSLPFLETTHTSPAFFANDFPGYENISDYVLKPLYSFAGLGVDMEPTEEKVKALENPDQWILQKKVKYAEFVPTPDGPRSKAEIRMMYVWPEYGDPALANNLVRMSQGMMMGVNYNKDKTWVGSSIALHSGVE